MRIEWKQGLWTVVLGLAIASLTLASSRSGAPVPTAPPDISKAPSLMPETSKPAFQADIPKTVRQGETLYIRLRHAPSTAEKAAVTLGNRKVSLFRDADPDSYYALLSIPVDQKLGGYQVTIQPPTGKPLSQANVEILNGNFQKQNIRVSAGTKGLTPLPGEMEAIGALKNTVTPTRHWAEPFAKPTPDCMNSPFGVLRYHNGKYTGDYHKGVDLRSPAGRPIRAMAGGVVKISRDFRLHGKTVGLDHGQGISSIYIHMSKRAVEEGQTVKEGDTLGYVGSTGFATGPHLHWGMYVNGLPVNPRQWVHGIGGC